MMFADRDEAGARLAQLVSARRPNWKDPIVLGLPRGGAPVAEYVADALHAELDIVIARKIGAPGNPEVAIGAIGPSGERVMDDRLQHVLGVGAPYIDGEIEKEMAEIRRREAKYRGMRPKPRFDGRDVVLVDDGIATGYTVMAAARHIRRHEPRSLMIATPVCPADRIPDLRAEADEVACISFPTDFMAVGQFYRVFGQVSDSEVLTVLNRAWARQRTRESDM
ncbi:MAG: phosphoribosyltransferase [Clostridia bacterium]|nr:phosphoribosyltransferase [Clostridia bacterium]